jgi:hypothetical protein
MRKYAGQPKLDNGWICLGYAGTHDGVAWMIYSSPALATGWTQIKIAADGEAPNKGNYWISWNGERFASGREMKILKVDRPRLLEDVAAFLKAKRAA